MRVCGIDIMARSPSSKKGALYAYTILDSKLGLISSGQNLSLDEVLKICIKNNTRILATDNIFELAEDLYNIILALRGGAFEIIKVNINKPLSVVAQEHNIFHGSKLSPLQASKVAAELALRGVGEWIKLFSDETMLKISRKHGISSDTIILSLAKLVESRLSEENIEYEKYVRRSVKGLSSVTFIISKKYADVAEIFSDISPSKAKFQIKPVTIRPYKSRKKPLIVGIDPGESVGIAILDLNGDLLSLTTLKIASISQIISIISSFGTPIIIACDVRKVPHLIEKIAGKFNAKIYAPRKVYSIAEKNEYTIKYDVSNAHERDALFAALKAFHSVKRKLEHFEALARRVGINPSDEMKVEVLKGKTMKDVIYEYLEQIKKRTEEQPKVVRLSNEELKIRIKDLNEKIAKLQKKIEILEELIKEEREKRQKAEELIEELQRKERIKIKKEIAISIRDKLLKEAEFKIRSYIDKNLELRSIVKKLRYINLAHERGYLVIFRTKLNKENILQINSTYGLGPKDLLLLTDIEDISLLYYLKKLGIRGILIDRKHEKDISEKCSELGMPYYFLDEISTKSLGMLTVIEESQLREIDERRKPKSFLDIIKEYKAERESIILEELEKMREDYKE